MFFLCFVCQNSMNCLYPIFMYSFFLYNIIFVMFSFILHTKFHWTVFILFYCSAFVSFVNINFNKVQFTSHRLIFSHFIDLYLWYIATVFSLPLCLSLVLLHFWSLLLFSFLILPKTLNPFSSKNGQKLHGNYSVLIAVKEMQIKTALGISLTSIRMIIVKKTNNKSWWECRQKGKITHS